tara:strand:- start:46 stop:345 length:300 start_codon:yes stop_codon:yes gene_type:complete
MGKLHKYSAGEGSSVALGQVGCEYLDTDTAATSSLIVAITFLEDSTFDTLTPEDTSLYMGEASGLGNDVEQDTFPKGITIYGRWTAVELETGRAVGYLG